MFVCSPSRLPHLCCYISDVTHFCCYISAVTSLLDWQRMHSPSLRLRVELSLAGGGREVSLHAAHATPRPRPDGPSYYVYELSRMNDLPHPTGKQVSKGSKYATFLLTHLLRVYLPPASCSTAPTGANAKTKRTAKMVARSQRVILPPRVVFVLGFVSLINSLTSGKTLPRAATGQNLQQTVTVWSRV